jgi:hypothetical protein
LAVATAHKHLDVLAIHTLGLGSVGYSVGILEVDTILVKEMYALLLIIWDNSDF